MFKPTTVPASPQETAAAASERWTRRGPLGRLVRLPEPAAVTALERDRSYARAA
jgi:hypothetical protein